MKTRAGFVSNSSSSSFCIYGTCFDVYNRSERNDIEEKAEKLGLSTYRPPEGPLYVGHDLTSCPLDVTMGDFRKGIEELLLKEFEIPSTACDVFEEGWYDG